MRKPGYYERHFICRNLEGYYSNFNIVARYNKHISSAHLALALRTLIAQDPIFVLGIFRNKNTTPEDDSKLNATNFNVRPVKSFNFDDVVKYEKISKFDDSVFARINEWTCPVDIELPLWRIVVFELEQDGSQYLCIYFEHALFDGGSGVEFHRDLAKALEGVENSLEENETAAGNESIHFTGSNKTIIVPPACEHTTNIFEPSWKRVIQFYAQEYMPKTPFLWTDARRKDTAKSVLFNGGKPTTTDLSTKYKLINLKPSEVAEIKAFCKSHGIALTSYLEIIGTLILGKTFLKHYKPPSDAQWKTSTLIAISGRRFLNNKKFQYGTLVTGDTYIMEPLDPELPRVEIVDRMQKFHQQLHAAVESKSAFQNIGLMQYLNYWAMNKKYMGNAERLTLLISNLGMLPKTEGGEKWQIEDMWFGLNTGLKYNFIFNVTSTHQNGLNIVLSYRPEFGQVTGESGRLLIDQFTEEVTNELRTFCKVT